ncbi:hypothetical protein [Mesorhizobium sp. M7A.F.Ca.MR.362.00.0.0]|uniref:hypothetical protein n=1 Tax=Mesorhizobium sp. M7A.F.Ca.MR.362.00.0.0 TaxID=2496779 RepID=UPI000FD34A0D|nr:hypothetical protein [Mesorhizobium sp. M7A.F.Ca.MR.362.00.0.0]RUU75101.1 hypothetical protein EOC06_31590 [Mesorhizobium sp. M7A.F.Ca.MR.362.00.0.0]RWN95433.1 MAG: hypothetical protein EOS05_11610 [Mesorhizobium sp.]
MAKLNIILGIAETQSKEAGMKPVMSDSFVAVETLVVTQVTQKSAVMCEETDQVWMLTALGGDVWVQFGGDPNAVVGDCLPLIAGVPYTFSASPGFTLAVISE